MSAGGNGAEKGSIVPVFEKEVVLVSEQLFGFPFVIPLWLTSVVIVVDTSREARWLRITAMRRLPFAIDQPIPYQELSETCSTFR